MLKYLKDLLESAKIELIQRRKKEANEARTALLKRFTEGYVNNIWYCKKEYINSISYDDDFLFDVCENCSTPLALTTLIYDKPAIYGGRDTLYKCRCGKFCEGI